MNYWESWNAKCVRYTTLQLQGYINRHAACAGTDAGSHSEREKVASTYVLGPQNAISLRFLYV